MHTIRHHLTDPILMAYAAGTLPEAFNLVVATHVSLCDERRAQLSSFEALGGEVMAETEASAMDNQSLAVTLALIGDPSWSPGPVRRARWSATAG